MSSRPLRLLLLTCGVLLVASPALARDYAPPDSAFAGAAHGHRPRAPRDTTRFLPRWVRPYLAFGGDWMGSPKWLKPNYEASQSMGAGLEARLHDRWALRAGLDYQMLQANHAGSLVFLDQGVGGTTVIDTVGVQYATNAWLGTLGLEGGVRTLWDVWLTGGGGVGYFRTGYDDLNALNAPDLIIHVPKVLQSGWGGSWTAAARYDFEPAPEAPLSVEVRSSALRRGGDWVQLWMIRVGYRIPDLPNRHRPAGPPRR